MTQRIVVAGQSIACCVVWIGASLGSAGAQVADRVNIDANRCLEIESRAERLTCFEAEVDRARGEAPASTTPAAVPSRAQAERTRQGSPETAPATAPTEWAGSIASLSPRTPGTYLITLDNGQIWEQRVAERYPLRIGQRVRIYETRWGSNMRLEAEGRNGFIQVVRVR